MADLPTINLALYAQTDVGMVRSGNEDNFLILDLSSGKSWTANEEEPQDLLTYSQGYYGTLLAVSDGMGGALAGEVASRLAVETVRDRMLQLQAHDIYGKMPFHERLRLAVEEANLIIHADGQTNQAHRGLGATFTSVATNGNQIYFAQVGDSRAYLIRQGAIYRITKDQSLVQQLIDAGQITEEEAETHSYRNVILQALGAHNNVNVEVNTLPLCQLDTLVLCSDGLSGKIQADDIARIVNDASDFKSACQNLINLANERGGEDNITVVIAQFSGSGLPLPNNGLIEPKSLARSPDTPTEISWTAGAKTDPLDNNSESSPNTKAGARATEPLPAPPSQSSPFTAPLQRNQPVRQRTNDLSDRVEPITAVFAAEDLESAIPQVAETANSQRTPPLDSRSTKPIEASSTQSITEKKSAFTNGSNGSPSEGKTSNANMIIFLGLVLVGIASLVIAATWYFKQEEQTKQVQNQEALKVQEEIQKQKESSIERIKKEIDDLRKKLEATAKPSLVSKRDGWKDKLDQFEQKLIGLNEREKSVDEVRQTCDEIEKELKEIQKQFDEAQGLLPPQLTTRAPIKI